LGEFFLTNWYFHSGTSQFLRFNLRSHSLHKCSATTKFVNPCDGVNVGTYPQFLFCPFLFICIVIPPKTLNYLTFQSFDFKRTSRRLFHQRVVCTKFDICVFYCSKDVIKYKQHVSRL
jgi:hypothetical protein